MAFAAAGIGGIVSGLFSAIGGILQAGALSQQAEEQRKLAEFNAATEAKEAARAQAAGQAEAAKRRKEGRRLAGKAQAALAQGGIITTEGSAGSLLQEITIETKLSADTEISNANAESARRQDKATAIRKEAEIRIAATQAQATASLISGFGGLIKGFG